MGWKGSPVASNRHFFRQNTFPFDLGSRVFPKTLRTVCWSESENAPPGIGVFQKTGERKGNSIHWAGIAWGGFTCLSTFISRFIYRGKVTFHGTEWVSEQLCLAPQAIREKYVCHFLLPLESSRVPRSQMIIGYHLKGNICSLENLKKHRKALSSKQKSSLSLLLRRDYKYFRMHASMYTNTHTHSQDRENDCVWFRPTSPGFKCPYPHFPVSLSTTR